jgi:hypothetical protein
MVCKLKSIVFTCVLCIVLFGCKQPPEPSSLVPLTAAAKFTVVNSLAMAYKQGIALAMVTGNDVSIDGLSDNWGYLYVDTTTTALPRRYYFHANSNGVGFDSSTSMHEGLWVITLSWFDSDSAVSIADNNGGSQFKNNNPNYTISAMLAGAVYPKTATDWYISYSRISNGGYGKFLMLVIDANTGEVKSRSID